MRTPLRFLTFLAALALLSGTRLRADDLPNLALKAKVNPSSVQTENPAEAATDGDEATRWCAEDGSVPQTLEVDLGGAKDVGGCEILWEQDGKAYQYVVEGSTNGTDWTLLNDQSGGADKVQRQDLLLEGKAVTKLRIRVTGVEEGCWASLFEFKVFAAADVAKLPAEKTANWYPALQPNLAKHAVTTSSSDEDGNPAANAVDDYEDTRWCNNGADVPAWLQVDLKTPHDLTGAAVMWEKADVCYKYKVEGSTDATTWTMLSDQTKTESTKQTQSLKFAAKGVRYVRITATELPADCWASIFEFRVFGKQ